MSFLTCSFFLCDSLLSLPSRRHTLKSGTPMTRSGETNRKVRQCDSRRHWDALRKGSFGDAADYCPGLVGISLTADWGEPVDVTNQRDIEAAERYIQFYLGWFATPLFSGDYPQVMKDYIGGSLHITSRFQTFRSVSLPNLKTVVGRAYHGWAIGNVIFSPAQLIHLVLPLI